MAKSKRSKVYAVASGRVPGIYLNWSECQAQTKGYSAAIFKSFQTHSEAEAFIQANKSSSKSSSVSSAASTASIPFGKKLDRKRTPENDALSNQRKKTSNQQKQSPKSNFRLQITIYFDGGSRGNPGLAGAGAEVVVVNNSNDTQAAATYSVRKYCGDRQTNNYAEYHGLLAGLKQAKLCIEHYSLTSPLSQNPLFQLQIYGDSLLIINQLKGAWQCKHQNIIPLFCESQQLIGEMKGLDSKSEVLLEHVYRKDNKVADGLANEAMDLCKSWITSTGIGSIEDAPNDGKESAAVVERKKSNHEIATPSKQRVIDVDGSGNESDYSC